MLSICHSVQIKIYLLYFVTINSRFIQNLLTKLLNCGNIGTQPRNRGDYMQTTDLLKQVGERLAVLRKLKKLKQSDIANYLGLTTAGYQNYVNGRREASYKVLIELADLFDVTIDYILGRSDEIPDTVNDFLSSTNQLTKTEKTMLSAYMKIDDRSKMALISILQELSESYKAEKERAEKEASSARFESDIPE